MNRAGGGLPADEAPASVDRVVTDAADDAAIAAALFAVDPVGTGGVALRAAHGPRRDAWLALLRELLPAGRPWRRLPLHVNDERLLGGLDLAATLHAGRPVAQRGVLAEADGGVLLLAMAERLSGATAARIAAVMDGGAVRIERDGVGLLHDTRFGVVALDEGIADDEGVPAALLDRLGFRLRLDDAGPSRTLPGGAGDVRLARQPALPPRSTDSAVTLQAAAPAGRTGYPAPCTAADIQAARDRLPRVSATDDIVQALCAAASALGVSSLRASVLALRVAGAAAALAGREVIGVRDAALAARLVLGPRATQRPAAADDAIEPADAAPAEPTEPTEPNDDATADRGAADRAAAAPPPLPNPSPKPPTPPADADADASPPPPVQRVDGQLDEAVLDAAVAAIPAGLLAGLKLGQAVRSKSAASGRAGAAQSGRLRGRPRGVRRGEPTGGARLNVLETLRAAAPWQALRRHENGAASPSVAGVQRSGPQVLVRRDDFRVTRFQQRSVTTTVFLVDASGSSALHRLAEAKGAVELLLADCYVRRDNVALLAFRGKAAELLLPPTRSLVRAKRSLAALPGGGGTPLAAGIDAAFTLADTVRRRGETPIVVLLTDGRANIARDGTPGRGRAGDDALSAARQFRAAGFAALLLDTSAQPQPLSAALAREMGAVYLPLPYAGAAGLSHAVLAVQTARRAASADAADRRGGAG